VVEAFGYEAFAGAAVAAGVDAVLLVDCPVEELAISAPLRSAGLEQILLAAPTTSEARLAEIYRQASGFLYYVSFAGVTGADSLSPREIADRVVRIRAASPVPVAVGFGVRDAASARAVAEFADGVVIGSALVDAMAGASGTADMEARIRAFLGPVREGIDALAGTQEKGERQ